MDLPERYMTLGQLKELEPDQIAEILQKLLLNANFSNTFYIKFDGIDFVKIDKTNLPQNLYCWPGTKVITNLREMTISKYYIHGMWESLKFLANRLSVTVNQKNPRYYMNVHEQYVLCVGYAQGDIQAGITGSIKRGESCTTSAIGELCEEAGMVCHPNSLEDITCVEKINGRRNGRFYSIDSINCAPINVLPERKGADVRNDKVCVFVHGTIDEIGKVIANVKTLDKSEEINHYAIIKLPLLIDIVRLIKTRQNNNFGKFRYVLR